MSSDPFPLTDAQVQGTLASIAYAGDTLNNASPTLDQLHVAINKQLNMRPHYATGMNWKLAWGPVEAKKYHNLIYAAYDVSTATLAISIRGTTSQAWSRFEDVPYYRSAFPDPNGSAKVSGPFLKGLTTALSVADKWQNQTFAAFYTAFTQHAEVKQVVVNGHSQGAALVPLMMLALQRGLIGAPKVDVPVSGFAYAPPTTGNADFAKIVDTDCDCWFIINPKDVVPLGYHSMMDVIDKGIPEELHGLERASVKLLIEGLEQFIDIDHWAQPSRQAILEGVTILGEGLFAQIDDQHNHNAYLAKLGAPGTDVGDPSYFEVSDPPVVTT
ncbi:MAG: hypothetical protein AAGP08_10685 [Pseudomonadota bacterium]